MLDASPCLSHGPRTATGQSEPDLQLLVSVERRLRQRVEPQRCKTRRRQLRDSKILPKVGLHDEASGELRAACR